MSEAQHVKRATTALAGVVEGITPDQLAAPTPCTEYAVRDLLNHLLFWGPSLEGAAHKEQVPPPAAAESDVDLPDDWKRQLTQLLDRMAQAWSTPDAWTGTTHMGGPNEMPSAMIGGMVAMECAVHTWDLARATDQPLQLDEDLVTFAHAQAEQTAEQGRAMGAFADEVAVPETAPPLHRLLALTGRDPAWKR
ncbi:TIGR03086 family metal-binding protein [Saccharopolyspora sp. NPDC000359]|uniref:TIGR03086 family metal-binding protein n=1 Tax=Saccharopolyspora sp. NPDC000359 TaxID=3154251 RepID=UPI003326FB1C